MIFLKTNPTDIDVPVQKLQELLHTKLLAKWGVANDKFHAYGRCYRNQQDNGYIPEVFTGGKEYKEVMGDDKVSVQSFFGVGDNIKIEEGNGNTAQVHLIFFVDLSKLKPSITHRGDAEVRKDVYDLLQYEPYGFTLKEQITGVDKVFSEYSGIRRNDGLKFRDMHPFHYFRFNLEVTYNPY